MKRPKPGKTKVVFGSPMPPDRGRVDAAVQRPHRGGGHHARRRSADRLLDCSPPPRHGNQSEADRARLQRLASPVGPRRTSQAWARPAYVAARNAAGPTSADPRQSAASRRLQDRMASATRADSPPASDRPCDRSGDVGFGSILAELALGLDRGDLQLDADDRLQHRLDVVGRSVGDCPRSGESRLVVLGQPSHERTLPLGRHRGRRTDRGCAPSRSSTSAPTLPCSAFDGYQFGDT